MSNSIAPKKESRYLTLCHQTTLLEAHYFLDLATNDTPRSSLSSFLSDERHSGVSSIFPMLKACALQKSPLGKNERCDESEPNLIPADAAMLYTLVSLDAHGSSTVQQILIADFAFRKESCH